MMQLILLLHNESIRMERGGVKELLDEVSISCEQQLKERGLKLKVSCEMETITMDKDLILSLLFNLIDNAGKASNQGDIIELCAYGNTISVKDHGKGIPKDEINKITQPFYMVDRSRSRKVGGVGLGLALAEEITRLHDARLEFESEPGKGTTVKVVFGNV